MDYLTKASESLLREILEHRYGNGNCDTSYWKNRFESLDSAEDVLLRSLFKELREYGAINTKWADNYPYILIVLGKGEFYFDELKREEQRHIASNSYVNNFYSEANNVQIQQGTVDSKQCFSKVEVDENLIRQLIDTINQYDAILDDEFGNDAKMLREYNANLSRMLAQKEDKTTMNKIVGFIKDLSVNAGGGLIAAGIINIAQMILG